MCYRKVVFGHHSCSHLMLFTTDDKLYSWNLINFAGMLSVQLTDVGDFNVPLVYDSVTIKAKPWMIIWPESLKKGQCGGIHGSLNDFWRCCSGGYSRWWVSRCRWWQHPKASVVLLSVFQQTFLDDPGLAGFDWFYASLVSGDNFWE